MKYLISYDLEYIMNKADEESEKDDSNRDDGKIHSQFLYLLLIQLRLCRILK